MYACALKKTKKENMIESDNPVNLPFLSMWLTNGAQIECNRQEW